MSLTQRLLSSLCGAWVVLVATCCGLVNVTPTQVPDRPVLIHLSDCQSMPSPSPDASVDVSIQRLIMIDDTFPSDEETPIREGLKAWEIATAGRIKFTIMNVTPRDQLNQLPDFCVKSRKSGIIYIRRAWSNDEDVAKVNEDSRKAHPDEDLVTLAYTARNDCDYSIISMVTDRRPIKETLQVALVIHEVGHALGLDHDPNVNNSIMYRRLDMSSVCITGNDLEQFCRIHGCSYKDTKDDDVPTEAGSPKVSGDALD